MGDQRLANEDHAREVQGILRHIPVVGPREKAVRLRRHNVEVGAGPGIVEQIQEEILSVVELPLGRTTIGPAHLYGRREAAKHDPRARFGRANGVCRRGKHRGVVAGIGLATPTVGEIGIVPDLEVCDPVAIPLGHGPRPRRKDLRVGRDHRPGPRTARPSGGIVQHGQHPESTRGRGVDHPVHCRPIPLALHRLDTGPRDPLPHPGKAAAHNLVQRPIEVGSRVGVERRIHTRPRQRLARGARGIGNRLGEARRAAAHLKEILGAPLRGAKHRQGHKGNANGKREDGSALHRGGLYIRGSV